MDPADGSQGPMQPDAGDQDVRRLRCRRIRGITRSAGAVAGGFARCGRMRWSVAGGFARCGRMRWSVAGGFGQEKRSWGLLQADLGGAGRSGIEDMEIIVYIIKVTDIIKEMKKSSKQNDQLFSNRNGRFLKSCEIMETALKANQASIGVRHNTAKELGTDLNTFRTLDAQFIASRLLGKNELTPAQRKADQDGKKFIDDSRHLLKGALGIQYRPRLDRCRFSQRLVCDAAHDGGPGHPHLRIGHLFQSAPGIGKRLPGRDGGHRRRNPPAPQWPASQDSSSINPRNGSSPENAPPRAKHCASVSRTCSPN